MDASQEWKDRSAVEADFRLGVSLIEQVFQRLNYVAQGHDGIERNLKDALWALRQLLEQKGYDVAGVSDSTAPLPHVAGTTADALWADENGGFGAASWDAADLTAAVATAQMQQIQMVQHPPQQPIYIVPQVPAIPGGFGAAGNGLTVVYNLHESVDGKFKIQNVGLTNGKRSVWFWDESNLVWMAAHSQKYRMKLTGGPTDIPLILELKNVPSTADRTGMMAVEHFNGIQKLPSVISEQEFHIKIDKPPGESGKIPHLLSVRRQDNRELVGSFTFWLTSKTTILNMKKASTPPSPAVGTGYTY